jgi:hypothetical protein
MRMEKVSSDRRRIVQMITVIASEAKQSIAQQGARVDCFVARAPRNDGKKKGRDRSRPLLFFSSWPGHLVRRRASRFSPAMTSLLPQFEARFGGEAGHDLIRVS